MKNIVIIAGPTASGKTALGIEVAKKLNGEIVSADSMQIYKYMNIGTAKPDASEMDGIPHHMIDIVEPSEEFSVALYRKAAGDCINDIISRGKLPIIVGGTGLYINSLTHYLDFTETSEDKEYRGELAKIAYEKGNDYVHCMLKEIDTKSYEKLYPNDLKRVIRALEVYKITGRTIGDLQEETRKRPSEFNSFFLALNMDRQKLYERINIRVDKMFSLGLLDEVKELIKNGYNRNMTAMQAIGYKEVFEYFDGKITLEEAKENIKQGSRRYAKRQLTWFRHQENVFWIDIDNYKTTGELIDFTINYVSNKLNIK